MAAIPKPETARGEGVKINVICRCRPPNAQEKAARSHQTIETSEDSSEVTIYQNIAGKQLDRTYKFDKVFGPSSGQADVYDGAISPIVNEVLEGFNCTVFAYGQTGTGKTHTMEGGDRQSVDGCDLSDVAGVIPRSIKEVFDRLESNALEYSVKVTFMELYNEELTDLLSVGESKLKLLEGRAGVVVQGLEEAIVKNSTEIYSVLDRGSAKRRTAATLLNKVSSRSHSIFTITIHMKESTPEGEEVIKIGKLNLVDLAGSENISRSGAKDGRAREAGNINQSLLTLGRVINALVEHQGHVPYRDSKLTRLLRDSLGGKTKTCIIATIAPSLSCQEETLSTLDYAHRAKNIRNKPEVNQRISKTAHIKDLTFEMERIKAELYASREKNGVYLPQSQFQEMELNAVRQEERITLLEAELEDTNEELTTTKVELDTISCEYEATIVELEDTRNELEKTTDALNQARQHIQERDFLIAAHLRSEQALATHAESLTDELARATEEITQLHAKIERKTEVEEANLKVAADLQREASHKFTAFEQDIGRNQGVQQGHHADLQARLEQFSERSAEEVASMSKQVERLAATVSELQRKASTAVEFQTEAGKGAMQQIADSQTTYARAATDDAAEAVAAAQQAIATLSQSLSAQKAELQAFADRQVADAEASLAATNQLLDSTSSAVASMNQTAETAKRSNHESTEEQKAALAAFGSSFQSSLASDSEALLASIGSLLSGFVQEKKAMVSQALEAASVKADIGMATLQGSMDTISSCAEAQVQALEAAKASAGDETSQRVSTVKASIGELQAVVDTSVTHAEAVGERVKTDSDTAMAALLEHTEAAASMVAAAHNDLSSGAEQATTELQAGAEKGAGIAGGLTEALAAAGHADAAFYTATRAVASECSEHVNNFCDANAAEVTALAASIQSATNSIQVDEPTAATPRKREMKVPPKEWVADMRTPARDVVLAEFRAQGTGKENVLKDSTNGAEGKNGTAPGVVEVMVKTERSSSIPKLNPVS
eukprot:jgi/Tetstr1/448192/TSEL_035483.t1